MVNNPNESKLKYTWILLCLFTFINLIFNHQAYAAAIVGFKPTLGKDIHLSTTVSPGKSKKVDYTVVNLTDGKLSVEASLDFPLVLQTDNLDGPNSARSFIALPQQALILDPSQRKYLSFEATIPANTVPGQYTAVLSLLKSDNQEILAQSKLTITVDGELKKALAGTLISNINSDKISLNFALENKGNTTIDNVVAHISLFNKNLASLIKLPKEFVIPLNTSLAVGEKVAVTKLLDTPLDPWANYEITVNLDYGAKQQLPLATQISYQNQNQINQYLVIGGIIFVSSLTIFGLVFKSWRKKYQAGLTKPSYKYVPKHHLSQPNTALFSGSVTLSDAQMQELIVELKKEVKTVIEQEINSSSSTNKVSLKKLAKYDLMDSFQRYLNS